MDLILTVFFFTLQRNLFTLHFIKALSRLVCISLQIVFFKVLRPSKSGMHLEREKNVQQYSCRSDGKSAQYSEACALINC